MFKSEERLFGNTTRLLRIATGFFICISMICFTSKSYSGAVDAEIDGLWLCPTCAPRQAISVTINWSPPSLGGSGFNIEDLAGYKIFLHNVEDDLFATYVVDDARIGSMEVMLSTDVTYIVSALSFTSSGLEGPTSRPKEYRFSSNRRNGPILF